MPRTRSCWPLALCFLFLLAFPSRSGAVSLSAGDEAPGFSLEDLDGNVQTLEQFRDRTVVIAFWSTWCSRCEEELLFLKEQFGNRKDVAVLLVNQDSEKKVDRSMIRGVRDRLGIGFPILIDNGLSLWDHYGINALPTSVVIGRDGKIRYIEANFYWASPERILAAVGPE